MAGPWLLQSLVGYTTGLFTHAAGDGPLRQAWIMPTDVPALQPVAPGQELASFTAAYVTFYMLAAVRVLGALTFNPLLGSARVPMPGRIGIGLFATLVLFPIGGPYEAPANVGPFEVGAELLVGLLAGFGITLIFGSIQFMGSLLGITSGFSFAQTINPMFDSGSGGGGVVETFITSFALLVFVQINGHHLFLIGLKQLFEVVPVGEVTHLPGSLDTLLQLSSRALLGRAQAGAAGHGRPVVGGPGARAAGAGRPAVQPVRAGDAGQDAARADRAGAGPAGDRPATRGPVPDRAGRHDDDRRLTARRKPLGRRRQGGGAPLPSGSQPRASARIVDCHASMCQCGAVHPYTAV